MTKNALIIVDLQNDFSDPNGTLYVPNGEKVVPIINTIMENFKFDKIVALQDWHPENHGSFASNSGEAAFTVGKLNGLSQIWWPNHCVQGSWGAEFHPDLNLNNVDTIFRKGTNPSIDSYSGFKDNGKENHTGLSAYLESFSIDTVCVVGLATDYCVKFTAIDACEKMFSVFVITNGCKSVNMNPGDFERAEDKMRAAGAHIRDSNSLSWLKNKG